MQDRYNMGFVSSRFAGTDGVTMESAKWAEVLRDFGHKSFWFAGKLDIPEDQSLLVPEAFFEHPENVWINTQIWQTLHRSQEVTRRIHEMVQTIKAGLYRFVEKYEIDFLIVQNAVAIPMHVPLGVAITEFLAETGMPAIAHNHDFYWERSRFLVNAVQDYLDMAFPPSLPNIQHATINSAARDELAWRKGLVSILVPNVLDFENPARYPTADPKDVRAHLGIAPDDILILQPTRVVPRKGIEHAISIVAKLKDPRCKLVISHESGDEGHEYMEALQEQAEDAGVDLRYVHTKLAQGANGSKGDDSEDYSLWDVYPCADLITYTSLYEGFGNALLETILFRKPIIVNRYSIWIEDIEPKGFRAISMDGFVTGDVVEDVRRVLTDTAYREEMVEHNYELAVRHYSYSVLLRSLRTLITNITGLERL